MTMTGSSEVNGFMMTSNGSKGTSFGTICRKSLESGELYYMSPSLPPSSFKKENNQVKRNLKSSLGR